MYNNNKALKMRKLYPVLEKRIDPFAMNLKAYLVMYLLLLIILLERL